jgi:SSS family solute:Na+ symporter
MTIEYITLAGYFVVLLLVGGIFARFNKNLSDFARGGGRATWWLMGSSITMAGISAFTFTGNGSAAFEAGPTFLVIYAANALGLLLGWLFLAAWYRQTRAYTFADVIRARFGAAAEQFAAVMGVLLGPVGAAVSLWALGIFVSAIFGLPLILTILVIGLVVVAYSVSGGSWAVMATDFVQGVVLFGITTLLAVLALIEIGGPASFIEWFNHPRVSESFQFIKEPGAFPGDRFTWQWIVVIFAMQLLWQLNLGHAVRYLAAKDGREARKAALFAMVLMTVGTAIWFLPPIVARFLYEQEVLATAINEPSTAAYAVIARNLLPNGLLGVMIAAMFSATMSSMDTGLTNQTSVIIRNIVPRIRTLLKLPPLRDEVTLFWCRVTSSILGGTIIGIALAMAALGQVALFDAFLLVASIIGLPMAIPLLAGLFIRRLPAWSYFFILGMALVPSIYSLAGQALGAEPWTIHIRAAWVMGFGCGAALVSWSLRRTSSPAHRSREVEFFQMMDSPVDFEKETGGANDGSQAIILGRIVTSIGLILLAFVIVPNPIFGRLAIVALSTFVVVIGILLIAAAKREKKAATEKP